MVSIQGPASLAIEIGLLNFVRGNVLVINTGYYSDRICSILKNSKKNSKFLRKIKYVKYS